MQRKRKAERDLGVWREGDSQEDALDRGAMRGDSEVMRMQKQGIELFFFFFKVTSDL